MKKWLVCLLSIVVLGISSIGFAAPPAPKAVNDGLPNLLYPKVGAIFFVNSGLRGDDKVLEQVKTAVFEKASKVKNITYLNDGLMSAKFQEYAFRKNIQDGNDLFSYGGATEEQLLAFAQENRLQSLIVVKCYLKDVQEKQSAPKPGEEANYDFTSTVEIKIEVLNPDRNGLLNENTFAAEGKSNIAIKSYWSAASRATGKLKSDWKPTFY